MPIDSDGSRWDPPLNKMAEVCAATALMARDISLLETHEPGGDLVKLDAEIDQGANINPLKFAHESTTAYLQGAGDLLHSIGRLVAGNPSAVSPSVLARCSAEYSAFAWWLSDPHDSPRQRSGKAHRTLQQSLAEHTMEDRYDSFRKRFKTWSSQTPAKIARKPDPAKLIRDMLGSAYTNQIKTTSWYVHADPITLVQTSYSAYEKHPLMRQTAWNDGFFALWAVITASERIAILRNGDLSAIQAAKHACDRLASQATNGGR